MSNSFIFSLLVIVKSRRAMLKNIPTPRADFRTIYFKKLFDLPTLNFFENWINRKRRVTIPLTILFYPDSEMSVSEEFGRRQKISFAPHSELYRIHRISKNIGEPPFPMTTRAVRIARFSKESQPESHVSRGRETSAAIRTPVVEYRKRRAKEADSPPLPFRLPVVYFNSINPQA